ncbi:hypothetical protein [Aequorivita flava]|uniref:EF-hand domain-containing protein n=2 Tax=Aequorivita TaxID=153265 RepID=A0AB35YQJ6_9FLAO
MEEFQLYLMMQERIQPEDYSLIDAHKKIIDDRVAEADANPDNYVTYQEFKDTFKKKINVSAANSHTRPSKC